MSDGNKTETMKRYWADPKFRMALKDKGRQLASQLCSADFRDLLGEEMALFGSVHLIVDKDGAIRPLDPTTYVLSIVPKKAEPT